MQSITLDTITQAVINHGDRGKTHPRLHEIYASLVQHLHDFVREVKLTESELQQGRDFLNQAVHHTQQIPAGELHMLTDLLGISELVELLHDTSQGIATESNLEGPLYLPDAPQRQNGDRLGIDQTGEPLFLSGRVLDSNFCPISDATIDVWQGNSQGFYDIQDPTQPLGNFRGRFTTDAEGQYALETVVPLEYTVPDSGPCGKVLRLLGRHAWRAAHIHFKLAAAGYTPLTLQIFIEGSPHLDSDTTFSVKSAIIKPEKHEALDELREHNQHQSFYTAEFNFVLQPISNQMELSKFLSWCGNTY
jgi:catechol 1,2-dioxygenase/hydroxyquinol 1,2-dioxygenase